MSRVDLAEIQPRAVVLALGGALVILVLGAYAYALKGDLREINRLRDIRGESQREVDHGKENLRDRRLEVLQSRILTLEERLYGRGYRLPASQMVSHIIGQLDRIARRHQVALASVKPGNSSAVLSFTEVPFDVEVAGAYFDLYAWLQDVEVELRPMVVKQFEFKPGDGGDVLAMNLRIVSYRSPGPAP